MESNDELIDALLPAVRQQLESNETVYVQKTYQRLTIDLSLSDEEACDLIAYCLAIATEPMFTRGKAFDHQSYRRMLEKLPRIPE